MAVNSLEWNRVNAWRLSQHCLAPRLKRQHLVKAATRTGGIQAQVLSAAELALWQKIIQALGLRRVLLVSDNHYLLRAELAFRASALGCFPARRR